MDEHLFTAGSRRSCEPSRLRRLGRKPEKHGASRAPCANMRPMRHESGRRHHGVLSPLRRAVAVTSSRRVAKPWRQSHVLWRTTAGQAPPPAAVRIPCRFFLVVPHAVVRGRCVHMASRQRTGIVISHPMTIASEAKDFIPTPAEATAHPPSLNANPLPENVSRKFV
ncbi:hypothetical protein Bcep18194_C7437 [Burkholderia lata]|uniref:Uncharacterized protein n=1 Tax=Burkholderia lata (strain ATCC 17760 / DSM 23089 / LMG 22485 / NCIMB 9086 / R18194 / 383) TaxID=482957 RepID=Q39M35_BURL3|nr:hypothetical protein Bcep18194_C7437 [Burkholderia lata]